MNNSTAEIEQLLAELVRITSQIAALTHARTDTPDDSESLASTANRLSLSAIIISVAAFATAALQAILEYSGSGESARRKCNFAAIGTASKRVRKKWSFRSWRRKFYYPVLELKPSHIITILERNAGRADRSPSPRATWAQLLALDEIQDMQSIDSRSWLDTDSIPSSLDVAPQMVNLVELGTLAVLIGFDHVSLSVENRSFQAFGKIGSITTEDITGFGKVVKFQESHPNAIGAASYYPWSTHARGLIFGKFNFEISQVQPLISSATDFNYEANLMTTIFSDYVDGLDRKSRSKDIYEVLRSVPDINALAAFARWRSMVPSATMCPSILVTLAIAGLPYSHSGFPARKLLAPFWGLCKQLAGAVCKKVNRTFAIWADFNVSPSDITAPDRVRAGGSFFSHLHGDLSQWAFEQTESLEAVEKDFLRIRLGLLDPRPGPFLQNQHVFPQVMELINNFDPPSWAHSQSTNGYRYTYIDNINACSYHGLVTEPIELLRTQIFVLNIVIQKVLDMLWKACAPFTPFVAADDVFALRTLTGGVPFVSQIIDAIVKGAESEESDASSVPFTQLEEMLLKVLSADQGPTDEIRKQIDLLADLLRLRVLVFAAYLMIIPDTSDIVEANKSGRLVLPMI